MSKTTTHALMCDRVRCPALFPATRRGTSIDELIAQATDAGWTPGRTAQARRNHYCPEHATPTAAPAPEEARA